MISAQIPANTPPKSLLAAFRSIRNVRITGAETTVAADTTTVAAEMTTVTAEMATVTAEMTSVAAGMTSLAAKMAAIWGRITAACPVGATPMLIGIIALLGLGSAAFAQCDNGFERIYRASEGLPSAACWNLSTSGAGGSAQIDGNVLRITSSGGIYEYNTNRPAFLWADGYVMEARLRVPSGGQTTLPGLRAGAYIGAVDAIGRINYIWIWATGVAISTDQNANPGAGLASMAFDAASAAHTYTLVSNATGVQLSIDGVARLSLPYTNTAAFTNFFQFGSDTRTTGPAVTEWEYVRLSPAAVAPCGNCVDRSYQSSEGLPSTPCWSIFTAGAGGTAQIADGLLNITSSGGIYEYNTDRPAFLWSDGYVMEARLRVPSGGQTTLPGLRAAAYIGAVDAIGRINYIWIWATGVAISTDRNANPGAGLASMAFDAASAAHTYTLVSNATGVQLAIDGVPRLSLPYTNTAAFTNFFQFGTDTRTTGPAVTEWEYVRLSSVSGPSNAVICPTGSASFSTTVIGAGPFTYQWQLQTAPNTWVSLGSSPLALPCGGSASAFATPANSPSVTIGISPCPGAATAPQRFQIRCLVTKPCGTVMSSEATYTTCPADINCSGELSVQDLFDFLNAYFAGNAAGNFNGVGGTTVQDIFDFLAAYFAGC